MADQDPFDVENLRLRAEDVPAVKNSTKSRRKRRNFIMITRAQSDRLDKAVHRHAEKVFRHLLFLQFRARGVALRLPNSALAQKGILRDSKRRALQELKTLGLIETKRCPRKSPEIRILDLPEDGDDAAQK